MVSLRSSPSLTAQRHSRRKYYSELTDEELRSSPSLTAQRHLLIAVAIAVRIALRSSLSLTAQRHKDDSTQWGDEMR
ncbi:hypothetical protein D5S18_08080 [Nocardia panacis]|uniref:Uncharacterized protein n=1 Tax=Nocardia panacis TaxID=2340916 RepID=A0A3A4L592_9NOCA|nr:hypothetical protein [Nocardia panacis]RJO77681.1 hypothetical protein D5S18_08080 [Nocardia panacis]